MRVQVLLTFGPRDFAARGISTLKLFPQSDLRRQAVSRWALLQIFSFTLNFIALYCILC